MPTTCHALSLYRQCSAIVMLIAKRLGSARTRTHFFHPVGQQACTLVMGRRTRWASCARVPAARGLLCLRGSALEEFLLRLRILLGFQILQEVITLAAAPLGLVVSRMHIVVLAHGSLLDAYSHPLPCLHDDAGPHERLDHNII